MLVNDQWLKESLILPGAVTGKLSDVAGLIVAVGLLSALFARTRAAVMVVGAAVGLTFSAINLSPEFASAFQALTAFLHIPWAITVDPTDLLALSVIPIAVVLIRRLPVEAKRKTWSFSRVAVALAAAFACAATSPPPPPVQGHTYFSSRVAVFNDYGSELTVRFRELRAEVEVDCFEIELDPSEYLSQAAFGPVHTWTMPVSSQVAPWSGQERDCFAVLIEIDGMVPSLLFWDDDLPSREYASPIEEGTEPDGQTVIVSRDGDGVPALSDGGSPELVFLNPEDQRLEPDEGCNLPPNDSRLAWATPVPTGDWIIDSVTAGEDGCFAMNLLDSEETDNELWFLCADGIEFPFEEGDAVAIDEISGTQGAAPGSHFGVSIDGQRVEDSSTTEIELIATRGEGLPEIGSVIAGWRESDSCSAIGVIDECGTYSRPGNLRVETTEEDALEGGSGDTLQIFDGDDELTIYLSAVAERFVVDTDCSSEQPTTGIDIELVSIHRTSGADTEDEGE